MIGLRCCVGNLQPWVDQEYYRFHRRNPYWLNRLAVAQRLGGYNRQSWPQEEILTLVIISGSAFPGMHVQPSRESLSRVYI